MLRFDNWQRRISREPLYGLTNPRVLFGMILAAAVCWRLLEYALRYPVFLDEASVGLNILGRGYEGLTRPLNNDQVAPLLFLWVEKWISQVFGCSLDALRLVPMLAGLTAAGLSYAVSRRFLARRAAVIAAGLVACSLTVVELSDMLKSYSLDLLAASVALLLVTSWKRSGYHSLWLLALAVFAPLSLGFSFPIIFVLVSVAAAVGLEIIRRRVWRQIVPALVFYCAVAGSFLSDYVLVIHGQASFTHHTMQKVWSKAFPPHHAIALILWLLKGAGSTMMTYPFGGKGGIAYAVTALVIVGVWHFIRTHRYTELVLLAGPFAATFGAAWLHLYPFAGKARVEQHLVPSIAILAAAGLMSLLALVSRTGKNLAVVRGGPLVWSGLLIILAVVSMGIDTVHPYRWVGAQVARTEVRTVLRRATDGGRIIFWSDGTGQSRELLWYLTVQRQVAWSTVANPTWLASAGHGIWLLTATQNPVRVGELRHRFVPAQEHIQIIAGRKRRLRPGWPPGYCQIFHLVALPRPR